MKFINPITRTISTLKSKPIEMQIIFLTFISIIIILMVIIELKRKNE